MSLPPAAFGQESTPASPTAAPAATVAAATASLVTPTPDAAPATGKPKIETIVAIRHGEKIRGDDTQEDMGQLDVQGFNRALALPDVLTGKFGRPDFIVAPLPTQRSKRSPHPHFYVRPLMTIEPTAVKLGMGVDTKFAFEQIDKLQTELLGPDYESATVFMAWEHHTLEDFARHVVGALGGDPKAVPKWPGTDFDSIFVLRIRTEPTGARSVTFEHDHEGLDGQSTDFPTAKGR